MKRRYLTVQLDIPFHATVSQDTQKEPKCTGISNENQPTNYSAYIYGSAKITISF